MKRKSKKPKIETEIIGVQLGIHGVKKELTGLVTAYLSKVDHMPPPQLLKGRVWSMREWLRGNGYAVDEVEAA